MILCHVYEADGVTFVGTLSSDLNRGWRDQVVEPGAGSVTVPADDPDAALLEYDRIVKMELDGVVRFGWIVEQKDQATIQSGEEAGKLRNCSGRGAVVVFETSVVEPEQGVGRFSADNRVFNYASNDYDAGGWGTAVNIKNQQAGGPPYVADLGDGVAVAAPLGMPRTPGFVNLYWIWSRAWVTGSPTVPPAPVGSSYFRKYFTLAVETDVAIFVTGDDGYELWLDGALVAQETKAFLWGESRRYDVTLDAGSHLVAARGINIDREAVEFNAAAIVIAVAELTDGGTGIGAAVLYTDDTWAALDYPDVPPAMTAGQILLVLIAEAQARGELLTINTSFTGALDSNGLPWYEQLDFVVAVGTNYLEVLRQLSESAIDWRFDAVSMTLNAYNRGSMAANLTGSIIIQEGVDVVAMSHGGQAITANRALVKYSTGQFGYVDDAGSVAAHGPKVAFASIGTAGSPEQVERVMRGWFAEHAEPSITATLTIVKDAGIAPYADFMPGDTVSAPGMDGGTVPTRLLAISVTEPDPGSDGAIEGTQLYGLEGLQGDVGGS